MDILQRPRTQDVDLILGQGILAVGWQAHTFNAPPIQEISDTVGHKSTHVTETVYRHVIVPAIRGGATVMDEVFGADDDEDEIGGNAKSA
jgi:hypothetical protein